MGVGEEVANDGAGRVRSDDFFLTLVPAFAYSLKHTYLFGIELSVFGAKFQ